VALAGAAFSGTLRQDHFGGALSTEEGTAYSPTLGEGFTRHVFSHDWNPSASTATHVVDDYQGYWSQSDIDEHDPGNVSGGEPYDIEAMYFDADQDNLYVSIVASTPPPPGRSESRLGGLFFVTGDLALDFGMNGPASEDDPFNDEFGVDLNNEVRQPSGNAWPNYGGPPTNGVYRTKNADWYVGTPEHAVDTPRRERTNFDPSYDGSTATHTGYEAEVQYTEAELGDESENSWETYVLDATIPRDALPPLQDGDDVGIQFMMGCRNDTGIAGRLSALVITIPEPGTGAVVGLLLALAALRRP
jgi:hypothetical protein